jgi:hypothetical protein
MRPRDRYFVDEVECTVRGESLRVANLGLGGFFAEAEQAPSLGEVLFMELRLAQRRCRVVGQIAWINEVSSALPRGFGVAVTWLETFDREYVASLLRRCSPVLSPSSRELLET